MFLKKIHSCRKCHITNFLRAGAQNVKSADYLNVCIIPWKVSIGGDIRTGRILAFPCRMA